jgi:hypothetical protein
MMQPVQYWRIFDFWQGSNLIEDWRLSVLGTDGRLKMNAALKQIVKIAHQTDWGTRDLKGAPNKEKIFELRFYGDKRAYRLAFVFEPGQQVILVSGFYHKQNAYYPPNAIGIARQRAADYRARRARGVERKISLDV